MGLSVHASVIDVLKQPSCKTAALTIELVRCPEHLQENPLDYFFGLAIVAQNCASNSKG